MTSGFVVYVSDNFHYLHSSSHWRLGPFATYDEALARAKQVVDRSLAECHQPGMTADELYRHYTTFGDDPFLAPDPGAFSAWTYAREQAETLTAKSGGRIAPLDF